jgi:hypothetical protein
MVGFAFALGARVMYALLRETKGLRAQINANDAVTSKQQREINYVLKRVNDLMHGGKVRKIVVKRALKKQST